MLFLYGLLTGAFIGTICTAFLALLCYSDRIVKHIMCKLTAFDAAIKASKLLEIDGVAIDGKACAETTKIKVLNSHNEAAYEVSVDAIVRQPLQDLILALETGLVMRLHGVTRIVGYYSRSNNWNKSKIGELHDRHNGDYAVGQTRQD